MLCLCGLPGGGGGADVGDKRNETFLEAGSYY